MKKSLALKIRETERVILYQTLFEWIESGHYYGNKEQHYKMCKELLVKLTPSLAPDLPRSKVD